MNACIGKFRRDATEYVGPSPRSTRLVIWRCFELVVLVVRMGDVAGDERNSNGL